MRLKEVVAVLSGPPCIHNGEIYQMCAMFSSIYTACSSRCWHLYIHLCKEMSRDPVRSSLYCRLLPDTAISFRRS